MSKHNLSVKSRRPCATSQRCALCWKRITGKVYILRDNEGVICGWYCSRDCAHADAWGPRFRPKYSVRVKKVAK